MTRLRTFAALNLLAASCAAAATVQSFETANPPAGWRAGPGSKLEITGLRFKSGRQSLLWTWSAAGATLTCRGADAFRQLTQGSRRRPGSVLALWLYNEKPTPAKLRFELRNGDEVVGRFWFYLNFRGWRPLGARYTEVGWKPGRRIDAVRLLAPESARSGRLFIDCVAFDLRARGPRPDDQQPWAGRPEMLDSPDAPGPYDSHDVSINRPWLPPLAPADQIPAQEREEMKRIEQRFFATIPFGNWLDPGPIETLRKELARFEIRRRDGVVTGRPIVGPRGFHSQFPDGIPFATWMNALRKVSTAYHRARRANDAALAAATRRMFFDLWDHLLDQGYAEGSGNTGWLMGSYLYRYWPPHMFGMREELAATGRLRDAALAVAWFMGGSVMLSERPSFGTDMLSNSIRHLPAAVMMTPDLAERRQRLCCLQRMFNVAFSGPWPFSPDGTVHHHGMHHMAYASYSMSAAFHIFDVLKDTSFRLGPEVHRRLRRYVYANTFASNKYIMPPNLNGRAGTPIKFNPARFARLMAYAGTPDGKQPIDREMAGLYLYLADKPGDKAADEFRKMGIAPLCPTGHWSFNGTCAALHRRKRWLVSIVGMFRFRRGLEIYGWLENNNYARYARNGSIFVVSSGDPPSLRASGWSYDGWNWCHWPGTTSLVRPSYELYDYYRMYGNLSRLAGGTRLGPDGIWGMDFRGIDVHFRKSAFCFDNRITVITTHIRSDQDRPAVTTLFQNTLAGRGEPMWLDGRRIDRFPFDERLAPGRPHWLIDNKCTGYYVHAGRDPIRVARRTQQWLYMCRRYLKDPKNDPIERHGTRMRFRHKNRADNEKYYNPTRGDYALAWFEHGVKPQNAACVYTLVVETTPQAMQRFATAMANPQTAPYTILRRDDQAHILHDRASNTTGYVLFAANERLDAPGLLLSNDQPCYVMVRPREDAVELSVASTDIERKAPIRLRVRGAWSVASAKSLSGEVHARAVRQGEDTLLELQPYYFLPLRVKLRKAEGAPTLDERKRLGVK